MAFDQRDFPDVEEQMQEVENLKKTSKKLLKYYMIVFMTLLIGTMTACATKVGDNYTFYGYQFGWWLLGITIIVGFLMLVGVAGGQLEKKFGGYAGVIVLIIFIVGLVMVSVDVETGAGGTVQTVSWDVEISSVSGSNVSYDDDAGTITCLCHVNSTAGTILADDDTAYTNPSINWSISPTQKTGLTNLDLGATSTVYATNPDYEYTEDGDDYYLIAQSSGGKRDLNFTNDGSSEYESKSVTVQFGTTEHVVLWINWYDTGVATLEAGESKEISVDICGVPYTIQIIVTGVIT